jgi:hypothetical protein
MKPLPNIKVEKRNPKNQRLGLLALVFAGIYI